MATQVVNEGSNMEIYQVGQKIKKDFQLLEAYDMTLEATITKLMYLMAKYKGDYPALKKEFSPPSTTIFSVRYNSRNCFSLLRSLTKIINRM